jgi:hypothetical protein
MKAPDSAEIFETTTSTYWFEGELLCVISKKAEHPSEEIQRKELEDFKRRIGNKRVCAIMDVSNATPSSKEQRERNAAMLPELFKAIAFIIKNPLTRMLAHIYLGAAPMAFPVKMFSNEEEARDWIKTQP